MRFAYADPPYPGMSYRYKNHKDYAGEVDHKMLIERLVTEYPDGWVLSTSTPALQYVLSLCPAKVRVGAWVKPFCAFKVGVNPAYAWEPVIYTGGRKRDRTVPTVRDWHSAKITLQKGLVGAKPVSFCEWIIQLMGANGEDCFDDLFPGTGIFTETYNNLRLEGF